MSYIITLTNASGSTREVGHNSISFTRTHTGLATFRIVTGYDTSFESWVFADIEIEDDDGEYLFRGELLGVDNEYGAGRTTLTGNGIGIDLTQASRSVRYQSILAHKAAEDYINTYTDFSATVTPPSPTTTVSDRQAFLAETVSDFDNITTASSTSPFTNRNGGREVLPISYVREAEVGGVGASGGTVTDFGYSNGEAVTLFSTTHDPGVDVDLEYTIPANNARLVYRFSHLYIEDWSTKLRWDSVVFSVDVEGETVDGIDDRLREYAPQTGMFRENDTTGLYETSTGSFTEETSAANDTASDDMTLLPASPSAGDRYYFGCDGAFDEIELDITTPGEGTYSVTWEYYAEEFDGNDNLIDSGWRAIPNVNDGTNGFRQSGSVTWDLSDIAADTQSGGDYVEWAVNDVDTGESDNYIRARLTSVSALSQQPLGKQARLRGGNVVLKDVGISDAGDLSGTVRIQFNVNEGGGVLGFDIAGVYDGRFSVNLDNQVHDDYGYLDGPERFPQEAITEFTQASTPWNIQQSDIEADIVGTVTGNDEAPQRLGVKLSSNPYHDGTSFSSGNPDTFSFDHGANDEVGTEIGARIGLGRTDNVRNTATPRKGFEGERVERIELTYDGNDIGVIEDQRVEGDDLANLQRLCEFAGMRFAIPHEPDTKEILVFRPEDVQRQFDGRILDETTSINGKDYANEVTVRSKRQSDGTRLTRTVANDDEIQRLGGRPDGVRHHQETNPELETQADVDSAARKLLGQKVKQDERTGSIKLPSRAFLPGPAYEVTWKDGETSYVPLEEITFTESDGDAVGTADFEWQGGLVGAVSELRKESRRNTNAL